MGKVKRYTLIGLKKESSKTAKLTVRVLVCDETEIRTRENTEMAYSMARELTNGLMGAHTWDTIETA